MKAVFPYDFGIHAQSASLMKELIRKSTEETKKPIGRVVPENSLTQEIHSSENVVARCGPDLFLLPGKSPGK